MKNSLLLREKIYYYQYFQKHYVSVTECYLKNDINFESSIFNSDLHLMDLIKSIVFYRSLQHRLLENMNKIMIFNHLKSPNDVTYDMRQIIRPLNRFGITIFTYARKYSNGKKFQLSNDLNYVDNCFNHQKFDSKVNELNICLTLSETKKYNVIYKHIDEQNKLNLVRYSQDYTEVFTFSGKDSDVYLKYFYINNLELFEAFIIYFEDRAEKHLKSLEKSIVKISSKLHDVKKTNNANALTSNDLIKTALSEMKIHQYKVKSKNVRISEREIECIASFQAGHTAKESAKILNVSYRTVEKYFENIKEKLNCISKKEVVKLLIADGFPQHILTFHTADI